MEASRGRPTSPTSTMTNQLSLYKRMAIVTHSIVFLYSAAFWIQVGVLPFLSRKLGVDTVVFGYLETVFAVAMLLGGPLFGRFGDIFGARNALCVAMISSFLSYAFLSQADSIVFLFLSRLMAFMMHAMHGAQMVMTDVSGTQERADALGKLGVSYGVGMVVGPTLGGFVTTYATEQFAAGVAAILSVIGLIIVLIFIPQNTKTLTKLDVSNEKEEKRGETGLFDVEAILGLLRIPGVLMLVVLKTLVGIPAGVFHSMFSMVNLERFQLTPESNGHLLSYVGLITMVMQGLGVSYFSQRFSEAVLVKYSVVVMALSYLCLSTANHLVLLCVVLIPMIMSGALLNTVVSSSITKKVPPTVTGTSLGLTMATHSVIRVISPTLGGYMYAIFGYASFGLLGFGINGIISLYLVFQSPP